MLHNPAFSGTGSNRSGMASASLLLRKAFDVDPVLDHASQGHPDVGYRLDSRRQFEKRCQSCNAGKVHGDQDA